jgi:hypothetical protein
MTARPILYAMKPCGCVALVMHVDPDTDQAKIVKVKRVIKRRGYKLEWLTSEEHAARSWECPEHKAHPGQGGTGEGRTPGGVGLERMSHGSDLRGSESMWHRSPVA